MVFSLLRFSFLLGVAHFVTQSSPQQEGYVRHFAVSFEHVKLLSHVRVRLQNGVGYKMLYTEENREEEAEKIP